MGRVEVGKLQFSCSGLERFEGGMEGHLVRVHSALLFRDRRDLTLSGAFKVCRTMAMEILRDTGLYWLEFELMGQVYKVKRKEAPMAEDDGHVWIEIPLDVPTEIQV